MSGTSLAKLASFDRDEQAVFTPASAWPCGTRPPAGWPTPHEITHFIEAFSAGAAV
jgi:hypothetical protein